MRSFFDPDNTLFRFTSLVLDLFVLSLMWLVCCLPVVTIGPATAALYYSCAKCLRYRENGPYSNFWTSFKENLGTGILTTLLFLVIAIVLAIGVLYLYLAAVGLGGKWQIILAAYGVLALLPMSVMLCAFALLSRFRYKVGGLLSDSFRVTLQNLPRLLAASVLVVFLALLIRRFWMYGVIIVIPALGGYLSTYLMEPVLRKYTPDYDPEDETDPGDRPWYLR